MVPARPRSTRRRPRGGPAARAVDGRLVRNASLLLLAPLLLLLFTTSRTGPLPSPELPPAFAAGSAQRLTQELARDYPSRVPGTVGADRAVTWYQERLALYGLTAAAESWREDVPGLGSTRLVNLVTVVPGQKDDTIVVIAHRDNDGSSPGANDNASGTAALVELLRGYASTGTVARRFEPAHTLVFVSSDGGAYGALGARRFARTSALARRAVAVLSLDGIAGRAWPRVELAGPVSTSPAPALVRTATVRVGEQLGRRPATPGVLTQLVDLGLPFGYGEQASFLSRGRSAIRITTAPDVPDAPDEADGVDRQRLGQLGRAAEATLASLDEAVQLSGRSAPFLYVGDRVIRGWAVQLLLAVAAIPFLVATVDLLARALRRGTRLAPTGRWLRRLAGAWLVLGGLVFAAALAGILPRGANVPPVADGPPLDPFPVTGLILLAVAAAAAWVALSRRTVPEAVLVDPIAAYTVAFAALSLLAVVIALVNPFALIFLLPSLYTWLWLPALRGRSGWVVDVVFGAGLAGPVIALVVLAEHLQLGLRTAVYALGLATSGTIPWTLTLCTLLWAAVAQLVAQLVAGGRGPSGDQPSQR